MPYPKRPLLPGLLILAVASVPVALGAAQFDLQDPPKEFVLGRLGRHRLLENELTFEYRGEIYVLRYAEYPVTEKLGTLTFEGDILAAPLREEMLRKSKLSTLVDGSAPQQAATQAPATAKR